MSQADPDLVQRKLVLRIRIWLARAAAIPRLNKLAWLSGAIVPGWLTYQAFSLFEKVFAPRIDATQGTVT